MAARAGGAGAGVSVKVLFLNPFHGGSHAAFAEGWARHSRHAFDIVSMPARFWKWRMRGAALHFARKVTSPGDYDALVVTDLMSLSDLAALWGQACPPALLYFHENQLSYPLPPGEPMDYQFGFTDITSALAARRVLFNSRFQHDAFFAALPGFIRMMPEFHPTWVIDAIRRRAGVLHPGVDLPAGPPEPRPPGGGDAGAGAGGTGDAGVPPLIIWNHRWEFDKNPAAFFAALDAVAARGIDFRVAILGENFQVVPKEFIAARERLGPRVVQYGFVESRAAYLDWLRQGTVVVSTADQENFGMSIVEAARLGCMPLVPRRLSYPEVIPASFHADCLYDGIEDLVERLAARLSGRPPHGEGLAAAMERYCWPRGVDGFDRTVESMVG